MKLELSWLEEGRWRRAAVQVAETLEYRGLKLAVHRPLSGTPCTWCVTEMSKGLSIVNFVLGTKRDALSAAREVLDTRHPKQWQQTLNKLDSSKLH
jgi:hypothetical protein